MCLRTYPYYYGVTPGGLDYYLPPAKTSQLHSQSFGRSPDLLKTCSQVFTIKLANPFLRLIRVVVSWSLISLALIARKPPRLSFVFSVLAFLFFLLSLVSPWIAWGHHCIESRVLMADVSRLSVTSPTVLSEVRCEVWVQSYTLPLEYGYLRATVFARLAQCGKCRHGGGSSSRALAQPTSV
jgi:hypothetical protein